jgi:branched-chain amino acid transport system ATP-binding protein
MNNPSTLLVNGLNAHYGRAHILFDLTLTVRRGDVMAFIGRNGAGKSTTMKAVMGLVRATAGEIEFHGERIERQPTHKINRLGIGYVPEDRRIFKELTVAENLQVGTRPPRPGIPHWTRERIFEIFPNLGEMRKRLGSRMSGGEQQMLAIARTLMGNPAFVMLDEPSEGLSPLIVEQMARTILALKSEGLTILISEQNLHFVAYIADKATVIEKGRIRYSGTMAELRNNTAVQQEYLIA